MRNSVGHSIDLRSSAEHCRDRVNLNADFASRFLSVQGRESEAALIIRVHSERTRCAERHSRLWRCSVSKQPDVDSAAAARASGTFFREAARDAEERCGGSTPRAARVAAHLPPHRASLRGGDPGIARLNLAEVSASSRSCVFGDRHRSKASLQKAPGRRIAAAS